MNSLLLLYWLMYRPTLSISRPLFSESKSWYLSYAASISRPPYLPYFRGCKLTTIRTILYFFNFLRNHYSLRSCLRLVQCPSIKSCVCLVPPFSMYFTERETGTMYWQGRGRLSGSNNKHVLP